MNDVAIVTGVIIILIAFGIVAYVIYKQYEESSNFENFKFVSKDNEGDVTSTNDYITVGFVTNISTTLENNSSVSAKKIVAKIGSSNFVILFGVNVSELSCVVNLSANATVRYKYKSKAYTINISNEDLGSSIADKYTLHIQTKDFTTKNIDKVTSSNIDSKYWYRYKNF